MKINIKKGNRAMKKIYRISIKISSKNDEKAQKRKTNMYKVTIYVDSDFGKDEFSKEVESVELADEYADIQQRRYKVLKQCDESLCVYAKLYKDGEYIGIRHLV